MLNPKHFIWLSLFEELTETLCYKQSFGINHLDSVCHTVILISYNIEINLMNFLTIDVRFLI